MTRASAEDLDRADGEQLERLRAWHEDRANKLGSGKVSDVSAELKALDACAQRFRRIVPTSGMRTVRLSDVTVGRVDWLWTDYVPRGMLSLINGEPGQGKSTLTIDLAARVSRGDSMPFDSQPRAAAASVLVMADEDDRARVICPRLVAAGANMDRVIAVDAMPEPNDPDAPPILTAPNLERLRAGIDEHRAALVLIDPITNYLPSNIDAYRDAEVRRVLMPLGKLAEKTGAAIVIVGHLRKGAGTALHRGGGSLAFAAAARSAWIVGPEPSGDDAADDSVRVIAPVKANLARKPQALRFRLVDAGGYPRIEWLGVAEGVTADGIASPPLPQQSDGGERSKLDRAVSVLRDVLANGAAPAKHVVAAVMQAVPCSPRTVDEARAKLGIHSIQVRTSDGRRVQRVDLVLPGACGVDDCGVEPCGVGGTAKPSDAQQKFRDLVRKSYSANDAQTTETIPHDRPPWEVDEAGGGS